MESKMDEDDNVELGALLSALSGSAARTASDAMDSVLGHIPEQRPGATPDGASLDWVVRAFADILARRSSRRSLSANQITAAVARAVQRGARFT
jgi:hypothetical protein